MGSTSCCTVGEKWDRCCVVGEMSFDGTELCARERDEQLFCILEVKKSINLLHCVTVWLWCDEV